MSGTAARKIMKGLREALTYAKTDTQAHACCCIGQQNGQPLCPCAMRGVTVENGRYVQKIDHGPVSKSVDHVDYLEAISNPRGHSSRGS